MIFIIVIWLIFGIFGVLFLLWKIWGVIERQVGEEISLREFVSLSYRVIEEKELRMILTAILGGPILLFLIPTIIRRLKEELKEKPANDEED